MDILKKNLNLLFFSFVFLIYQLIFLDFFPNHNGLLGNDYEQFLPNFIFGKIWFNNNLLSVPWFSPSFCCGTPFYPDPQTAFYSIQQLFYIFFEPILATKILFIYFSFLGYCGMFFLLRKNFEISFLISLLGAIIFIFNGFYLYRAIVGHVAYMNFILIPLYCFFLIEAITNKNNILRNIYLFLSALLFSSFFYSGSGPIMPLILLSIIFVLTFFYFKNEEFLKIFSTTFKSLFIGILISLSKITASLHFLKNFDRKLPPTYFDNLLDYLIIAIKSLFLFPDIDFFNSAIENKNIKGFGLHEIEFGVSVLPLLILLLFLLNFKNLVKNQNFSKIIITSLVIIFIPIILNTNYFNIQNIWNSIPILGSSWTQFRWTAFYIIPLIFFTTIVLENIKIFKYKNTFVFCLILVVFIQNILKDKSYYHNQSYNPKNMTDFSKKIDTNKSTENLSINGIASFINNKDKLANTLIRNDFFMLNFSAAFCYQPIFGYGLEEFPFKNIVFNKKKEVSLNKYLISGELNAAKDKTKYNFLNPSCFIFSKENNCFPGDLFKKSQKKELENFLNYKQFKFKKNKFQNLVDYMSVVTFLLIIIFLIKNIYSYIKKIN